MTEDARADSDRQEAEAPERLLGAKDLAERLGVDRRTVRRYLRDGKLPSEPDGQGGRLVRQRDLEAFLAERADRADGGQAGSSPDRSAQGPRPSETALALRAVLEDLSARVREERVRADDALRALGESEAARGAAEAEATLLRSETERLRAELADERAERIALERRAAQLEEKAAAASRGLLARLFGRH